MNDKIYEAIGKKNGVSADEVKKEIQAAIDAAFVFPTPEALKIPCKGEIPTIDEIIDYVTAQITAGEDDNNAKP